MSFFGKPFPLHTQMYFIVKCIFRSDSSIVMLICFFKKNFPENVQLAFFNELAEEVQLLFHIASPAFFP